MKKPTPIIHIFIVLIIGLQFSGCIEPDPVINDLTSIALTGEDVDDNLKEQTPVHVTESYTVEPGKLFEGMLVLEKYEVVFMNTSSEFIVQQLAVISSVDNATHFITTLQTNDTIPGVMSDYIFSTVPFTGLGDQSVLKTNMTVIDGNQTQLYMLVFRVNDVVCILVSGSLDKEAIVSYGSILESRLQQY